MLWIALALLLLAFPCLANAVTLAVDFTRTAGLSLVFARSVNGGAWSDVATVPMPAQGTTLTWTDPSLPSSRPIQARYQVTSMVGTSKSGPSNQIVITEGGAPLLPQSAIVAAVADSQEMAREQTPSSNTIDAKNDTIWHTVWSATTDPPLPHTLTLDLGSAHTVDGLGYRPRPGKGNGTITDYEIQVSTDGTTWVGRVQQGSWLWSNQVEEITRFTPTVGRFVRLRALQEVYGNPWSSAAELWVYAAPVVVPPPVPASAMMLCRVEKQPDGQTIVMTCTPQQ